jgi:hypothetical protein
MLLLATILRVAPATEKLGGFVIGTGEELGLALPAPWLACRKLTLLSPLRAKPPRKAFLPESQACLLAVAMG